MDYTFTLAQEADASAVYALCRSLVGTPGCTWNDFYPTSENVAHDIRTSSLYVLKDAEGSLIAAAFAGPDDELAGLHWDMENPCELARVAVSRSIQNRGIGSYLLKRIIPAVQARGFDGIRMLVSTSHAQALALYDKNGFTRLDEITMYDRPFYRYQMIFKS